MSTTPAPSPPRPSKTQSPRAPALRTLIERIAVENERLKSENQRLASENLHLKQRIEQADCERAEAIDRLLVMLGESTDSLSTEEAAQAFDKAQPPKNPPLRLIAPPVSIGEANSPQGPPVQTPDVRRTRKPKASAKPTRTMQILTSLERLGAWVTTRSLADHMGTSCNTTNPYLNRLYREGRIQKTAVPRGCRKGVAWAALGVKQPTSDDLASLIASVAPQRPSAETAILCALSDGWKTSQEVHRITSLSFSHTTNVLRRLRAEKLVQSSNRAWPTAPIFWALADEQTVAPVPKRASAQSDRVGVRPGARKYLKYLEGVGRWVQSREVAEALGIQPSAVSSYLQLLSNSGDIQRARIASTANRVVYAALSVAEPPPKTLKRIQPLDEEAQGLLQWITDKPQPLSAIAKTSGFDRNLCFDLLQNLEVHGLAHCRGERGWVLGAGHGWKEGV